jgi:hypothetical protein
MGAMAGDSSGSAPAPISRGRHITIWVLIVLGALIGLLSVLATWINRQVVSDSSWKVTSSRLIQNDEIRGALSTYLVNQLYDNVNVSTTFQQKLPPALKPLAGPLAGALRQPATSGVDFLLSRPRVQAAFVDASSLAHEKLINVLENKTGFGISTGNGTVTLDLSGLLQDLGNQLGLPAGALSKIPPDAGVITIMSSDQLGAAQTGFRAIKVLSVWLFVIVFILFAAALWLARGIRRAVLRDIGWAFVVVGILTILARNQLGGYVVHKLAPEEYRVPAHEAWVIGTSTLNDIGWAAVLYGVIAILGAVLAGPTRWATAVRAHIAPTINERPGVAWASAAFAYLLLIFWGGTHALRTWFGILFLGALLALGVWAFRRETLREFPVADKAPAEPPPPPPAAPTAAATASG